MIKVHSGNQAFWLNFEHQLLPGANVRAIPRYETLENVIACLGDLAERTMDSVMSTNDIHEIAETVGTTLADIVNASRVVAAAVEHGLSRVSHRTLCKISVQTAPDASIVIVEGEALTMKGDPFNRRTGRWWSLTRAMELLQEAGIGEAGDFLEAYLNRGTNDSASEVLAYVDWYESEYLAKHPRMFMWDFQEAA